MIFREWLWEKHLDIVLFSAIPAGWVFYDPVLRMIYCSLATFTSSKIEQGIPDCDDYHRKGQYEKSNSDNAKIEFLFLLLYQAIGMQERILEYLVAVEHKGYNQDSAKIHPLSDRCEFGNDNLLEIIRSIVNRERSQKRVVPGFRAHPHQIRQLVQEHSKTP